MAKKAIYVVNIVDEANTGLIELYKKTIPSIQAYATKIGADYIEITKPVFTDFSYSYEAMQIYELGKDNDWNIYIDADYLIRDTFFDVTEKCPVDAVGQWGPYGADSWFNMDSVFEADTETVTTQVQKVEEETGRLLFTKYGEPDLEEGTVTRPRHIAFNGSFVVASSSCHEIWKPLSMSFAEALVQGKRRHFLAEYTYARNLAANHYKLYTFKTLAREQGAQSDDSELLHLNTTIREVDLSSKTLTACTSYLAKTTDSIK